MKKNTFLDISEIIDAMRIIPRMMITVFTILYASLILLTWDWFTTMDVSLYSDVQLAAVMGFPTALLAALGAMLTSIFNKYVSTGRNWANESRITRTWTKTEDTNQ